VKTVIESVLTANATLFSERQSELLANEKQFGYFLFARHPVKFT
jgi:hypothetical protein